MKINIFVNSVKGNPDNQNGVLNVSVSEIVADQEHNSDNKKGVLDFDNLSSSDKTLVTNFMNLMKNHAE